MKRILTTSALIGLFIAIPRYSQPWATLTGQAEIPADTYSNLKTLINDFASDKGFAAETDLRKGPHPIHQFVLQQAFKMLRDDPAYADGLSGLPSLEEVNAWDGIDRKWVEGVVQRPPGSAGASPPVLASSAGGVSGPSPDAERLADLSTWNPDYNGAAHYWNPWLQSGDAPRSAAHYFVYLVHAILEGGSAQDKARFAEYMCHYMGDVASAKHADAFMLDSGDVQRLKVLADQFVQLRSDDAKAWLSQPQIAQALAILQAKAPNKAYWDMVVKNMSIMPLKPGGSFKVDVMPASLESAVGCYLWFLGTAPPGQPVNRFYNYFDPFYFNGQMIHALMDKASFDLGCVLSNHMVWESNPAQFQQAASVIQNDQKLLELPVDTYYPRTQRNTDYYSLDENAANQGRAKYMGDLLKECSQTAHGPDLNSMTRFSADYTSYMYTAIRFVYSALRSSISAMRLKAKYSQIGEKDYRIRVTINNLAGESLNVDGVRILTRRGGKIVAPSNWNFEMLSSVGAKAEGTVKVELRDVDTSEGEPEFIAEVHGHYDKTPDSGVRRIEATKRGNVDIIKNPGSAEGMNPEGGPLDLGIVFDVTGSMGSSIESMKTKAEEIVAELQKKTKDMRLATCAFRDSTAKDDKPEDTGPPFELRPFTKDIGGLIAGMGSWKAKGGGDTNEDQLQACRMILDLWAKETTSDRHPTKIIIVITDAGAHSPDTFGNTFKSIATLAEKVDPAHIYPVIVGSDPEALDHANQLASGTGGKVITASDYGQAADKLLEAVNTAVKEHPAPAQAEGDEESGGSAGPALLYTGIGIFGLGVITLLIGVFVRR